MDEQFFDPWDSGASPYPVGSDFPLWNPGDEADLGADTSAARNATIDSSVFDPWHHGAAADPHEGVGRGCVLGGFRQNPPQQAASAFTTFDPWEQATHPESGAGAGALLLDHPQLPTVDPWQPHAGQLGHQFFARWTAAPPPAAEPPDPEDEGFTTDFDEVSGSDDESSSNASAAEAVGSDHSNEPIPPVANNPDQIRAVVEGLLTSGIRGPEVLKILARDHNVHWSARTLARRRQAWNLQRQNFADLPPPPLSPQIRACLISAHKKGLILREMQARLAKQMGREFDLRTVRRYLRRLNLKQRVNHLLTGQASWNDVYNAIEHVRIFLCKPDYGYRSMWRCLRFQYGIQVPRQLVYEIMKLQDPEGFERRLGRGCERRIFRTYGPNHIWACDGHDKLQAFGIRIYGFIDAWSRRVLGLFAHATNKDPCHVAVWFLRIAKREGGIPLLVTTDYGSETTTMAELQMFLSWRHDGLTLEQATKCMHWTKSTHNQKIECLWSQLMKKHNSALIDNIYTAMEVGTYDDQDPVQRLLFLFLWLPMIQYSLDNWAEVYNNSRRRRDKRISLPTGCSAEFAYTTPEYFGTCDQLVQVPGESVDAILQDDFPDMDRLFTHTPPWFSTLAYDVMNNMGIRHEDLTVGNVWRVFGQMLPHVTLLCYQFPDLLFPDMNSSSVVSDMDSSFQIDEDC